MVAIHFVSCSYDLSWLTGCNTSSIEMIYLLPSYQWNSWPFTVETLNGQWHKNIKYLMDPYIYGSHYIYTVSLAFDYVASLLQFNFKFKCFNNSTTPSFFLCLNFKHKAVLTFCIDYCCSSRRKTFAIDVTVGIFFFYLTS